MSENIDFVSTSSSEYIANRINRAQSPWGDIDSIQTLAPGIDFVSTSSHGGIHVDDEHEDQIPIEVRQIARAYAPAGWYEEDCDLVIPVLWFADELIQSGNAELVHSCQVQLEVYHLIQAWDRYRCLEEALNSRKYSEINRSNKSPEEVL